MCVLVFFLLGFGVSKLCLSKVTPLITTTDVWEGRFRYGHAHIRTFVEPISFIDGILFERSSLNLLFSSLWLPTAT